MSYELETKNRGLVGDFGFFSSDTNRVMLGELPAMPTAQFCGYASTAILEAYRRVGLEQKTEIKGYVDSAVARINRHRIRSTKTVLDMPRYHLLQTETVMGGSGPEVGTRVEKVSLTEEFAQELNEAFQSGDQQRKDQLGDELLMALGAARGEVTHNYPENPFTVKNADVVIGETYVVDPVKFTAFATSYMAGGIFGWGSRGTPDYTYLALRTLKEKIH